METQPIAVRLSELDVQPLAVNVATAAKMVGVSQHTLKLYVRRKLLRVTRLGRRVCIPVDALRELVRTGGPSRESAPGKLKMKVATRQKGRRHRALT